MEQIDFKDNMLFFLCGNSQMVTSLYDGLTIRKLIQQKMTEIFSIKLQLLPSNSKFSRSKAMVSQNRNVQYVTNLSLGVTHAQAATKLGDMGITYIGMMAMLS